ncbi:MAG: hypothetical protein J7K98_02795 [Candidatus Aenigmarchaeota archaeon]|nr:hypothetical protein [Candidatus Aenigmarchaeota archaeon]
MEFKDKNMEDFVKGSDSKRGFVSHPPQRMNKKCYAYNIKPSNLTF